MSRLESIATRQRATRVRDTLFAVFITIAAVISLSTVASAATIATTHTPTLTLHTS